MLIDQNSERKGILKPGEQKSLQTERVILVPGPDEEVRTVRRIYEMFTREGKKEAEIADWLNGQNIVNTELNRPWSKAMVHQILTNEKYIGNNVYNRRSFKLKKKRVQNPPARPRWRLTARLSSDRIAASGRARFTTTQAGVADGQPWRSRSLRSTASWVFANDHPGIFVRSVKRHVGNRV